MNRFFCCFKKKKKATINSYVEYYSNHDTISDTSITNSLIDALTDDNENIYMDNHIRHDNRATVVGVGGGVGVRPSHQ
jgi:hypothetical protein